MNNIGSVIRETTQYSTKKKRKYDVIDVDGTIILADIRVTLVEGLYKKDKIIKYRYSNSGSFNFKLNPYPKNIKSNNPINVEVHIMASDIYE